MASESKLELTGFCTVFSGATPGRAVVVVVVRDEAQDEPPLNVDGLLEELGDELVEDPPENELPDDRVFELLLGAGERELEPPLKPDEEDRELELDPPLKPERDPLLKLDPPDLPPLKLDPPLKPEPPFPASAGTMRAKTSSRVVRYRMCVSRSGIGWGEEYGQQ